MRSGFIRLRGLPPGKVKLALTLSHPYFLPRTIVVDPAEYTLERGREATARILVPRLGGAIQVNPSLGAVLAVLVPVAESVPATDAATAKTKAIADEATAADPLPLRRDVGTRALVGGIPPGRYRVTLFADAEAAHPVALFESVTVEPGRTVRL